MPCHAPCKRKRKKKKIALIIVKTGVSCVARVFGFGHFLYFSRGNEGWRGTDFYDTARDLAANLGTNTCRCASLQQEARREIRKKEKKKKKRERRKNCSSTMK